MTGMDEKSRDMDPRKERLLRETLEKMARAESIARGLGVGTPEINRLKHEGILELSHLLFA